MSWLKGYTKARDSLAASIEYWRSLPDEYEEIIFGPGLHTINPDGSTVQAEVIKKNTLPDYWNDDLWIAIDLWKKWKTHGLPFRLGWAEHPAMIIDAIDTCEEVISAHYKDKAGHNGNN